MKIKAVFLNQWHQPLPDRKKQGDLGSIEEKRVIPVPVGAIFMKVEEVEDDAGR